MNTDEGTLSFGSVFDTSGIDEGINEALNRFAELGEKAEFEGGRMQQLFSDIPKINIEMISNVDSTLSNIDAAFENIDYVMDSNKFAIKELEAEYKRLGVEMQKAAGKPGDNKELATLKEQRAAIKENIAIRKKLIEETEKAADQLSAFEQKVKKEAKAAKQAGDSHVSMRTRLRELKEELIELEASGQRNTQRYRELQEEAGRLTDAWGDATHQASILAHDQRGMQGIISGLSGVSGAFSAAQGAVGLFAGENEELQKIMLKVQSLMAITMGLQQVQATLDKDSAFRLVTLSGLKEWWNKLLEIGRAEQEKDIAVETANSVADAANTAATEANTAAQELNATATGQATAATGANTAGDIANTAAATSGTAANIGLAGAFRMVGAAIKSIPVFGWIAAAIGVLIGVFSHFSKKSREAAEAWKEIEEVNNSGTESFIKAKTEIEDYQRKLEKFTGTEQQEKKLVDELNSKYGESIGYHKTLAEWKNALTEKGEKYAQMLLLEAQAQAVLTKYTAAYMKLQEKKDWQEAAEENMTGWEKFKEGGLLALFGDESAVKNSALKIKKERQKDVDAAQEEADKWEEEYKKIQERIISFKKENGLDFHIDPDDTKSGFDSGKAASDVRKSVEDYMSSVKEYLKDANSEFTDLMIESQEEGLEKELMASRRATDKRLEQWESELRNLAEKRKQLLHDQYMGNEGATEAGWQNSSAGEKTVDDYMNEILSEGGEIAENYYRVRNQIIENGEKEAQEIIKSFNDSIISDYGSYDARLQALRDSWEKIINTLPEEYRAEATMKMNEAVTEFIASNSTAKTVLSEMFKDLSEKQKKELDDLLEKSRELYEFLQGGEWDEAKGAELGITKEQFETLRNTPDELERIKNGLKDVEDAAFDAKNVWEQFGSAIKNAFNSGNSTKDFKKYLEQIQGAADGILQAFGFLGDQFSELGESFGNETLSKIGEACTDAGDTIKTSLEGAFAGFLVGGPIGAGIGAAIGLVTKLTTTVNKWIDKGHQEAIEALQDSVDELGKAYEAINYAIEKAYGKDKQRLYDEQAENLRKQNELIQQQIEEEQDKKDTDEDAVRQYQEQIEENNRLIEEMKENAVDAIFGSDIQSAIDDFVSAITDAWGSAGSASESARNSVRNMMKSMVTEAIKAYISASGSMERIRQALADAMADDIITEEERQHIEQMAEELANDVEEKYGWTDDIFSEESGREGMQKGIAAASQDSVDENNARLTTIQGHTFSIMNGLAELNGTAYAILSRLTGIENNTAQTNGKIDTMYAKVKQIDETLDDFHLNGIRLKA